MKVMLLELLTGTAYITNTEETLRRTLTNTEVLIEAIEKKD